MLRLAGTIAVCTIAACTISGSDRDKATKEIRKETERARMKAEKEKRQIAYERHHALVEKRFFARFEGKVQPGVGCDVCPDLCEHVDLRPMEPDAFQARFRRVVHVLKNTIKLESALADRERYRLMCIAKVGGKPLREAMRALMGPSELPMVRFYAAFNGIIEEMNVKRGYEVLHVLAAGGEEESAVIARVILEQFDLGLWLDY